MNFLQITKEFSNLKIRVYKDSSTVFEGNKVITGITQANPAVVTSNGHGYTNGNEIKIRSVVGMTEVNEKRFLVANVTTNTFSLTDKDGTNISSAAFTAYTSGGIVNRVFEITTPYTTAQLFDIKFVQSADVMYLCHPAHPPATLSRTNPLFTVDSICLYDSASFINTTDTTLTPSICFSRLKNYYSFSSNRN